MKRILVVLGALSLLAGCLGNGPEKPLREMASALTKKDSALFLAQMDTRRFAAAQINNLTQGDTALRALDSVGKMLGLGGMDELLGSVMNMQMRQEEQFTRGVSTGELVLECRKAVTPDCPWTPEALQNAKVRELGPDAAVARVTTPANISSWLALSKVGERWLVVGQAPLEGQAVRYAQGKDASGVPAPSPESAPQPAPGKEKPQESVKL